VGTYRVQAIGPNKATSYISNGKQGLIHRDKYLNAGKPCPMEIVIGIDPVSFLAARYTLPDSVCEHDWAGALTGQPLDVIEGEPEAAAFTSV
jgi:UbiD family decarboxylase